MSRRREWGPGELAEAVRAGETQALAHAISLVENGDPAAAALVGAVYPETGRATSVGVTGSPGAGKSTVISALVRRERARERTVGVISVDPTSPFTQGALLGDRIRLAEHFLDPGVFIRSMATRGHGGGLAEATLQALLILDASGKDAVYLETVGTGQTEIGVLSIADTVVLVLLPGSGDSIQALKAGIMEIPDVIVVNKRDHPLARATVNDVRQMLGLAPARDWEPPIVLTEATRDEGIDELLAHIDAHVAHLTTTGQLAERRRRNVAVEVFAIAAARARHHLESAVLGDPELNRLLEEVRDRKLDPFTAVNEILEKVFKLGDKDNPDTR